MDYYGFNGGDSFGFGNNDGFFGFGNGGFGFSSIFPIMFFIVFFLIVAVFIVILVKGVGEWSKNNNSPRLTVNATVVAKRTHISRHHNNDMHSTHTRYYVTFQVDSGDRMELYVGGNEYGLLIEGDVGQLTFQGTRYLGFERL